MRVRGLEMQRGDRCSLRLGGSAAGADGFMEQRMKGTMAVWAEPFVKLRLAKFFNLRTDPYEFADVTSNEYYKWLIYHAYILYGAMTIAQKFAETFKEFPIIQKPNTFTIDDAIKSMHDTVGGAGH